MHSHNLDISINKLAKIEGHADLDIKIRKGVVKEVSLRVAENKRFFTQAMQGQNVMSVPQLTSRICGTCSTAHLTACIEAVEKTLEIKPSSQTIKLRKLMTYALMIRDHALHLYYFVLPDLYKVDSVLDLAKSHKELIHQSLHVKEAGNNLSKLVAGRSVHPTFASIGGFNHVPDKAGATSAIKELRSVKKHIVDLAEIFYKCKWKLDRKTKYVALKTKDFSFLEGEILCSDDTCIAEKDYWNHLHDVVIPYSEASGFKFEGDEFMVGALPRLNLNKAALHKNTQKSMKKYIALFPSTNVYLNNLAQVIEIMHCIDHSIELLQTTTFKKEKLKLPKKTSGEGVGVIEAPRGTLYYWMNVKDMKIKSINLVIPTAQNLLNMREDVRKMVEDNVEKGEAFIKKEAEKIIRAYDPCMSCASHFLRIHFDKK